MKDSQKNIVYVGSTSLKLENLEANHRNAREKNYTMTKFRTALEGKGVYKFEWLVYSHMMNELQVLTLEDRLINKYLPRLNEKYNNTDKKEFDSTYKYRGVYGVTYEEL